MTRLDDLHHSIVRDLQQHADPEMAAYVRRWYKNEDSVAYGVPTAAYTNILRAHKPTLMQLPLTQRLGLAKRLIQSGISEQASIANWILTLLVAELRPAHLKYLDQYVDHFRSWSTTDSFCIDVLQPLLWRYRQEVLTLLKMWNRSPNRWKRRASVVAFVRKAGASGEFTDDVLALCENLVEDQDDLVQKGVGWVLKDNMRGAKSKVLKYVKRLRHRGVSSTITLYAIRDVKGKEREAVIAIRANRHPRSA